MAEALLERLIELDHIDAGAADELRKEQRRTGKPLPAILAHAGHVTEETVLGVTADLLGIPLITSFAGARAATEYIEKVPIEFSRHYAIVALAGANGRMDCVMANPFDTYPMDEVAVLLGHELRPAVAPVR